MVPGIVKIFLSQLMKKYPFQAYPQASLISRVSFLETLVYPGTYRLYLVDKLKITCSIPAILDNSLLRTEPDLLILASADLLEV